MTEQELRNDVREQAVARLGCMGLLLCRSHLITRGEKR